MKLGYVELCGFRGFRDKVRVNFGPGFTVLTGRNGVGKSTICDAIEYAILGDISKYPIESAGRETVKDYIWWRGKRPPKSHYVILSFVDETGKEFTITRSREGGVDKTDGEIEAALCGSGAPDDPLRQICRTSLIRDEWISGLSLDLTETQRFDFVRAALGSVVGSELATKAKSVVGAAESACETAEKTYDLTRSRLADVLAELSKANDVAARNPNVASAIAVVDAAVPSDAGDLARRIDIARQDLPSRHRRLEGMSAAVFEGRELEAYRASMNSLEAVKEREQAKAKLGEAQTARDTAQAEVDKANQAYEVVAKANEVAASLSSLITHGQALGLYEGHYCPLCAAERTDIEFAEGLAAARKRMTDLGAEVNAAAETLNLAKAGLSQAEGAVSAAAATWARYEGQERTLRLREERHIETFERYQIKPAYASDPDELERQALVERDELVELERALNALEASRAVDAVASTEARANALRRDLDVAADELARAQKAVDFAKSLERNVRRSATELVDERLALISPLLNELYQRLRPHADWRSIEYSVRGDVRKFLSLRVGDNLNPQFVFSSGQRRAAGLAFLLSVYLARPWARWQSLILDDPVQHIDDFRALHLVEVLSSLRQAGRQVVIAVEDEALADLLCRRLLSTDEQIGRRYVIDYGEQGAADVASKQDVAPMATGVLRRFDGIQAVS